MTASHLKYILKKKINWDMFHFLLWPMDLQILGPKQPNVSSHTKASCQMLQQLMAQVTEVTICFGQLSFSEQCPKDGGQTPDGSGWVLWQLQGHRLLAGSGGTQQIPRKISARGGGI